MSTIKEEKIEKKVFVEKMQYEGVLENGRKGAIGCDGVNYYVGSRTSYGTVIEFGFDCILFDTGIILVKTMHERKVEDGSESKGKSDKINKKDSRG